MRCKRCGRGISPLRLLTDRDFCSEHCRRKGPRASSWILRDLDFEEPVFVREAGDNLQTTRPATSGGMMVVMMVGLVGALMMAKMVSTVDGAHVAAHPVGGAAPMTTPEGARYNSGPDSRERSLVRWLEEHLLGRSSLHLRLDFDSSTGEWTGSARGWLVKDGKARIGDLRLWKPTLTACDYEFEFEAEIESKGISWVYRAENTQTYYTTRIELVRPGISSNAMIVRYGRHRGTVFSRKELPLPVPLELRHPYRICTTVVGARFTTLIDGRVVDVWSDPRLVQGGVGFFAEDGEQAILHWASFREHKSLLDRFLNATLWLAPGSLL